MEIKLFACIARINRGLSLYHNSLQRKDIIFSSRSQGDVVKYPSAPIIFAWCFQWEKDSKWKLSSEHNTEEVFDLENRFQGEFLFEYSFDNFTEMTESIERTKNEFLENLQKIINL